MSRRDRERSAATAAVASAGAPPSKADEADACAAPPTQRPRSGLELHRVVAPNVVADGTTLGGEARSIWQAGDVGVFRRADVESLPGAFEPAEAP